MGKNPAGSTRDRDLLVDYLHDHDAACPLCGHNLRKLTAERCPECGKELTLAVALVEPYLKAWIALAAIVFAGSGMGLFFIAAIIKDGLPPYGWLFSFTLFWFIAYIPLALVVVVARKRLLRLTKAAQWWCAAVLAGASVTAFLMFIYRL